MEKNYIVYKHTTPSNKIYIGITCSLNNRWRNGAGYHHQRFYRAIQKYGWDNIKHEILYSDLTKEDAEQKEIELIAYYKSNNPEFGYNVSAGGEGFLSCEPWNKGGHIYEETKEKLRRANLGKKHSEKSRKKMSESRRGNQNAKGYKFTVEQRARLSAAQSGEKNGFYGKKHTEETRKKMRKNHADFKRGNHPQARKVICLTTNKTYCCIQDAADDYGLSYGQVKCNCLGKSKTTGKTKLQFKYVKE